MAFGFPFICTLKSQRASQWLPVLFACLGILYLLPKLFSSQDEEGFVFRMIWMAGKLWTSGQDPYGPLFVTQYESSGLGPLGQHWNYPLYWYPIAVSLGHLPLPVAAGLWKAINFMLLIAATHLTARALADCSKQQYASIFASGLAFVCFMQAVAVSFYNGQTSIIAYFGLAAFIFGLLKRRGDWVSVGVDISRIEATNRHRCLRSRSCSSSLPPGNPDCRRCMHTGDGSSYGRGRLSRCHGGISAQCHRVLGARDCQQSI